MAMGLTFRDGAPATMARGKYQTRNQRLAEITGFHTESGETNGRPWTKKIWDGNLLMSDCRTVDTRAGWSDDGHFLHQEGVQSPFDLCLVVSQEFEAPAPPEPVHMTAPDDAPPAHTDPTLLEQALVGAALAVVLKPEEKVGDNPVDCLKRIISERDAAVKHLHEVRAADLRPYQEFEALQTQRDKAIMDLSEAIAERDALIKKVADLEAAASVK